MEDSTYVYIDQPAGLPELLRAVESAGRVALDTEADSLHHYFEKVCLIQITVDGRNYIVDPLAGLDLKELFKILSRKPLLFHGADYDLRMLFLSFGFQPEVPSSVFDTMLAAQLAGHKEFGLAAMLLKYFNVALSKQAQKSDWARRPLSAAQLTYASEDTRHLEALAQKLEAELAGLERAAWHREACERTVATAAKPASRPQEDAWRIKGSGKLDRRQQACLRELWRWRDEEARQVDRPAFMVLGNHELLELALWTAAHPEEDLSKGPKLPVNCRDRRREALEQARRRAAGMPPSDWPAWPPKTLREKNFAKPSEEMTLPLPDACARLAAGLDLVPSLIAPRAALEAIARERAEEPEAMVAAGRLMRWQAELLAPVARQIFSQFPASKR